MMAEQILDLTGRAVADADPDGLRRRAAREAQLMEVGVLGDGDQVVRQRVTPDIEVVSRSQADVADVNGAGEEAGERRNEPMREVLIEAQARQAPRPGTATNVRSRSAANARHARMSSASRSGKSATISASVIPDAR